MTERICGWGINDADFIVCPTLKGKKVEIPTYRKWKMIITRTHSKAQLIRDPEYEEIIVCEEWQYFTNFHNWMNNYIGDITGLEIDKDIYIPGNKIYEPDTCCFVSRGINNLFRDFSRNKKSGLPPNIYTSLPNSYRAQYNGQRLGTHKNIEVLVERVNLAKAKHYEQLAEQQTDERIFTGLLRHADLLRFGTYNF